MKQKPTIHSLLFSTLILWVHTSTALGQLNLTPTDNPNHWDINFDPITMRVNNSGGQLAWLVFEDFYAVNSTTDGTYVSGTIEVQVGNSPTVSYIPNNANGTFNSTLGGIDPNDLFINIAASGPEGVSDGVIDGAEVTISTSGIRFSSNNVPARAGGPVEVVFYDNFSASPTQTDITIIQDPNNPTATIENFSVTISGPEGNQSAQLTWNVIEADSVMIDQGIGTVTHTGQLDIDIHETTTWTLTATRGTIDITAQVTATLSRGEIRVFLMGGQSNMAGQARTSKLPTELLSIPEVMFYAAGSGVPSAIVNQWTTLIPGGGNLFGPEIGLGQRLTDICPNQPIAIIKYAVGGTNLYSEWDPGANFTDTSNWGVQFTNFNNTVINALTALEDEGWIPVIYGMCWLQGERDARNEAGSNDYGDNLAHFISRVREQYSSYHAPGGFRFVPAQVLPYSPAGGTVETTYTGAGLVRQAILDVDMNSGSPLSDINTISIPTNHLDHPTHENEIDGHKDTDEVHLNSTALLTIGRSMANAFFDIEIVSYTDWASSYAVTGLITDDDDSDGFPNGLEYAHGKDPSNSLDTPLFSLTPISSSENNHSLLNYSVTQNLRAVSVNMITEFSTDLDDWESMPPQLHSSENLTEEIILHQYRAPSNSNGETNLNGFFRTRYEFE